MLTEQELGKLVHAQEWLREARLALRDVYDAQASTEKLPLAPTHQNLYFATVDIARMETDLSEYIEKHRPLRRYSVDVMEKPPTIAFPFAVKGRTGDEARQNAKDQLGDRYMIGNARRISPREF